MFGKSTQHGVTLVELMVALVIIGVVMVGVTGGYLNFQTTSKATMNAATNDAHIKKALKLLQRDLNMAGFGLPRQTRVASHDQGVTFEEQDTNYDYNEDGTIDDTKYDTDRIFVADGWEILRDVTDNNEDDGNIYDDPINEDPEQYDYFSKLADKREDGGYHARLDSDTPAGAAALTVEVLDDDNIPIDDLNINVNEECVIPRCEGGADDDLKAKKAVLVFGQDAGTVAHVEGHRTSNSVVGNTVPLLGGEALVNQYQRVDSAVVPGIAWYIQVADDGIPWLYRNENRVVPNVVNFQLQYGFDLINDGLEWYTTVPPGVADPVDGDLDNATRIESLKSVRVELTVKQEDAALDGPAVATVYEEIINLRN